MDKSIETCLSKFSENLWMKRRLEVVEIIKELEKLSEGKDNGQLKEWINFFKFLQSECSGTNYQTDKQWSELMNLMEISKILNHRSVKLKNILKNRPTIERNANKIKRFNRSVLLLATIEATLANFEQSMAACCLEFPPDSQGDMRLDLLADQITKCKQQLKDKCTSVLNVLKMETRDELLRYTRDSRIESWLHKVSVNESLIIKWSSFLDKLHRLQLKLIQMQPLIGVEIDLGQNAAASNSISGQHLGDQIAKCKKQFAGVYAFNLNLYKSLHKLSNQKKNAARSLLLMKLVKSNIQGDSYSFHDEETFNIDLNEVLVVLGECQDALNKIMQTLRLEFGRFYFINDLELLTLISLDLELVLGSDLDLHKRSLIGKLFNNSISAFLMDSNNQSIVGIKNPVGEIVAFQGEEFIPLRKKINVYSVEIIRVLNEVLRKLRRCLKRKLFESLAKYQDSEEIDWSLPTQLLNLKEYLKFTQLTELCINQRSNFDLLIQTYEDKFNRLSCKATEGNENLVDLKRSAIISLTVHFISTLLKLKSINVSIVDDWHWKKQVRYYNVPEQDETITVHILDSKFSYKFDYLPLELNHDPSGKDQQITIRRLINTQITEKCFLIASYALKQLKLGSNPYGPAGCGKTETIKALGQLLGNQVIVHNCDETNDHESLEKLIWGFAHTGLWGCFDEFNRLNASVLSSISSTLELVQSSLREDKTTVEYKTDNKIEGQELSTQMMRIDPNSAFFITLNPIQTDNRYRGRRRLPANLRNLFIPISMVQVEIDSIVSENLLILGGQLNLKDFKSSKIALDFGFKFKSFAENMKSALQQNLKCEWDLRLIMAILKRIKLLAQNEDCRDRYELTDLVKLAVEYEVAPRMNKEERSLTFRGLNQVFAGNQEAQNFVDDRDLVERLSECCNSNDIQENALNLHQQLKTRSGVLLLGPTRSGKSKTWKTLFSALKDSVEFTCLNPKSCNKHTLFGYTNGQKKWIDGLLVNKIRSAQVKLQSKPDIQQIWLVLDGPIDSEWIESLNSVLDDNQVLTLNSGERLAFNMSDGRSIKLIFESDSIEFASPASISRLGLVYHERKDQVVFRGDDHLPYRNLREFIEESDQKLLITLGDFNIDESKSSLSSYQVVSYNCAPTSGSEELLEVLNRTGDRSLIWFKNVHLIQCDQWNAQFFVELLIFTITYHGYYDMSSETFSFIYLNDRKFIISLDCEDQLESINSRLISLAKLMNNSLGLQEKPYRQLEDLNQLKTNISIIAIKVEDTMFARNKIASIFDDFKLSEFKNTEMTSNSMKLLEESTSGRSTSDEKRLFILSQMEFELMNGFARRKLLHLLNYLNAIRDSERFLYMFEQDRSNSIWSSFGTTVETIGLNQDMVENFPSELKKILSTRDVEFVMQKLNRVQFMNKKKFDLFQRLFMGLLTNSKLSFSSQEKRFVSGLQKLNDFDKVVESVKMKCDAQERDLNVKNREIELLMKQIDQSLEQNQAQKEELQRIQFKQISKVKELDEKEAKLNAELAKVKPLVEASKLEIVKHLKPEALNEIKSLRLPPKTIKDILDVLFLFLKVEDSSWVSMRSYLTKNSLKDELTEYNFSKNMTDEGLILKIEQSIRHKQDSFNPTQAAKASKAIVPIMNWILAALEYGKALIKISPLTSDLSKLRDERAILDESASQIETESVALKERIRIDSEKLTDLRQNFESSKVVSDGINKQLLKASKIKSELGSQIERWHVKLDIIKSIVDGESNLLTKLCLMASVMTINAPSMEHSDFDAMLTLFELKFLGVEQTIEHLLLVAEANGGNKAESFAGFNPKNFDNRLIKDKDVSEYLLLIKLKLCLTSSLFAFLDFKKVIPEATLAELPAFKSIISRTTEELMTIRVDDSDCDWQQSLEVAIRLNKLILLELSNDNCSLDLDIINALFVTRTINDNTKLVILGSLELHNHFSPFVIDVEFACTSSKNDVRSIELLQSTILDQWIQLKDPDLNESIRSLDGHLTNKRMEIESMEENLLHKLSIMNESAVDEDNFDGELVGILGHLQESSDRLKQEMMNLNAKIKELSLKKDTHIRFSTEAAQFYSDRLANLNAMNAFYQMSTKRYLEILLESENAGFSNVIEQAMWPLRPDHKRILANKEPGDEHDQLSRALCEFVGKGNSHLPKLMIILHDSMSPSPQVDVDNYMRAKLNLQYIKTYATSVDSASNKNTLVDSIDRSIELAIDNKTVCLCIANAHLAADYLNLKLRGLMRNRNDIPSLALILVAESLSTEDHVFSIELLSLADVKFSYEVKQSNIPDDERLLENLHSRYQ